MYALKARDKLHKKAKEEKRSPRNPKRKSASGGNSRDCPVTVNREAKVSWSPGGIGELVWRPQLGSCVCHVMELRGGLCGGRQVKDQMSCDSEQGVQCAV